MQNYAFSLKIIFFTLLAGMLTAFESAAKMTNFPLKTSFSPPNNGQGIRTLVIDAGHGGKDSGCLGKKTTEKEVVLDIALILGQIIAERHPEIKILYTRESDVFVPLHERAHFANKHKADLFLSIHCNAVDNPSVRGTETFVLGLHRAKDNLEVAKRENASILLEKDYQENYEGYDPNSAEGHIMMSLFQNVFLDQSIHLAYHIENAFQKRLNTPSRGVKQAGFLVLRNAAMPSVLVEAGFLSNPEDEKYLNSAEGKRAVAESIYESFFIYKKKMETPSTTATWEEEDGAQIYVQIGLAKGPEPEKAPHFAWLKESFRIQEEGGYFKQQVGPFANKSLAMDFLQKAKGQGISDAFIVGYKKGNKIKFSEL
jgi:N-acetylmuramoyl-L-alanine amidase